jgi:capsular polysaccharide transport system ATP-binding protein
VHGVRGDSMRDTVAYVQDFAQIGAYFDQPVSTYSSGMRARLAFGTSMAFHFDYYLIDEIMAVGDAGFKAKSRALFAERLKVSRVVLVSHNMNLVRKMCDAVVHLDAGRALLYRDVEEGIAAYQAAGTA